MCPSCREGAYGRELVGSSESWWSGRCLPPLLEMKVRGQQAPRRRDRSRPYCPLGSSQCQEKQCPGASPTCSAPRALHQPAPVDIAPRPPPCPTRAPGPQHPLLPEELAATCLPASAIPGAAQSQPEGRTRGILVGAQSCQPRERGHLRPQPVPALGRYLLPEKEQGREEGTERDHRDRKR